jgi:hypothetical protein
MDSAYSRSMKKPDPWDNPERNAATLQNLVANFEQIGVESWLEKVSFDRVVEAWWQAQARVAEREERERLRCRKS